MHHLEGKKHKKSAKIADKEDEKMLNNSNLQINGEEEKRKKHIAQLETYAIGLK